MKITADTNVLLRLVLADDEAQGLAAVEAMEGASLVAISVHSLCELAWVWERSTRKPGPKLPPRSGRNRSGERRRQSPCG
jgi:predicted nucleic-acid-binding protein